jgi:hypothetical protein
MKEKTLEAVKKDLRKKAPSFAKKIAPIYRLLEWKWLMGVPTEQLILEAILELIEGFRNGSVETGGIKIYWDAEERCYALSFKVEERIYY